jgi:hypothetical protein
MTGMHKPHRPAAKKRSREGRKDEAGTREIIGFSDGPFLPRDLMTGNYDKEPGAIPEAGARAFLEILK